MTNGGAYLVAFIIALAILLTWAIVEIVKRDEEDKDDPRPIPEGDSDLQLALNEARPGSVINIEEGVYYVSLTTAIDGTEDEPITLRGKPGTDPDRVILKGEDDKSRVLEILHSYYVIEDFTIDGEIDSDDYREQLIFVEGVIEPSEVNDVQSSVDGTVIRNMRIRHAGKECIHMRYYVTNSVIANNVIEHCGIYHFVEGDSGKTGEGVYIGTATDQWDDKNGDEDVDICQGNVVTDNYIDTQGNEGVEVKEGSMRNIVQYNEIYGQMDDDSGGIGMRGSYNIVRYNLVVEAVGSCIRLGGDDVDGVQYGINNEVYGNELLRCQNSAVKVIEAPQIICENTVETPEETDDNYLVVRGDEADGYNAEASCPSDLTPVVIPPTPTPPTDTTTTMEDDDSEAITSFSLLGCYADDADDRVLEYNSGDRSGMTVQRCVNACFREDEDYAGLQFGSECWCGSSDEYDRHGKGSCGYLCAGDSSAICGGSFSFSLYALGESQDTGAPTPDDDTTDLPTDDDTETTTTTTTITTTTTTTTATTGMITTTTTATDETGSRSDDVTIDEPIYLGCFADSESNPILNDAFESDSMTLKLCFTHCNDQDDELAGLKAGDQCRCGNADNYNRFGTSTCTSPCSGDSRSICGGTNSLSVYRVD